MSWKYSIHFSLELLELYDRYRERLRHFHCLSLGEIFPLQRKNIFWLFKAEKHCQETATHALGKPVARLGTADGHSSKLRPSSYGNTYIVQCTRTGGSLICLFLRS